MISKFTRAKVAAALLPVERTGKIVRLVLVTWPPPLLLLLLLEM